MIRVAVIGAGAWGLNHIRALVAEPDCEVAAIADPDRAAGERAAALAPRARWHEDAAPVLADPQIDALVIATPSPLHAELTCRALAAGKHVLVEKPLALSLAEARRVAAAAADSPRVAMVGHLMVYHPAVVRLRELVRSGELGPLRYLHAIRANLGRIRPDESVLWSFGPHDLSMLDFIFESRRLPDSVSARGQAIAHPGVEDVVFLTLRYGGGELAHIHLSRLHPRKERRLTIVGGHKLAELDDVAPDKLRIYARGYDRLPDFTQFAEYLAIRDGDVHIPQLAMVEPLRLELRHFLDCIRDRRAPLTDLASGLRVAALLDAAQRSLAADGAPITLSTVDGTLPPRANLA